MQDSHLFFEKDNSFLTPWRLDLNASMNDTNSTKEKEYLSFHPASYFTYELALIKLSFLFQFMLASLESCSAHICQRNIN